MDLLTHAEERRIEAAGRLVADRRADMGQFFTPPAVARFLASLFDIRPGAARLLDPGAGTGSLTASFVSRWCVESEAPLQVHACEAEGHLVKDLESTLSACSTAAGVKTQVEVVDFVAWAIASIEADDPLRFDYVIMNPPYRKLAARSDDRVAVAALGVETSNLYAAFVALAIRLLAPEGQLVAIIPRSFANGPYFRSFRKDLLSNVAVRNLHVFDTRDSAFADSDVLQENVVIRLERGTEQGVVVVSSSASAGAEVVQRSVPYSAIVLPDDGEQFIRLPSDADAAAVARSVTALPTTLETLGLIVSTGKVVDFRSKEHLRSEPDHESVPLIYPTHMVRGSVVWPRTGKKPNGIVRSSDTERLLLDSGCYVLVKRFSSKEERRRVVASLVMPADLPGGRWAFENHLNVFHLSGAGMDQGLALGLAIWLNSTAVDTAFREFSGHTQVNATDLRNMRYPSSDELLGLAAAAGTVSLDQEKVDRLVTGNVSGIMGVFAHA